jgi:hypothetical protein
LIRVFTPKELKIKDIRTELQLVYRQEAPLSTDSEKVA